MQALMHVNNIIQRVTKMGGCLSQSKPKQQPVSKTEQKPSPNMGAQKSAQQPKTAPYRAPPSLIESTKPPAHQPQPKPSEKPRYIFPQDEVGGYPDMDGYGNARNNYMDVAGKQSTDILQDEDYGYYAANGRNISMRVDINK